GSISPVVLIGVLCATLNGVRALEETQYPDWKGQWVRADSAEIALWDPRKPWGLGQQPPLTPEYQAVFEANLKQLAVGAKTSDPTACCIPGAMPRVMTAPDKRDLRLLLNEITTFDNALSGPWTVTQSYRRAGSARPTWTERIC